MNIHKFHHRHCITGSRTRTVEHSGAEMLTIRLSLVRESERDRVEDSSDGDSADHGAEMIDTPPIMHAADQDRCSSKPMLDRQR